jgi:hypothetical protein
VKIAYLVAFAVAKAIVHVRHGLSHCTLCCFCCDFVEKRCIGGAIVAPLVLCAACCEFNSLRPPNWIFLELKCQAMNYEFL